MDAYSCAYRDPKSPLTPLTPLTQSPFNFNFANLQMSETLRNLKSPVKPQKKQSALTPNYRPRSHDLDRKPMAPQNSIRSPCSIKISQHYDGKSPASNYVDLIKKALSPDQVARLHSNVKAELMLSPTQHRDSRHPNVKSFKRASPVHPKVLSPRVSKLLHDIGRNKYASLFEKEEIDWDVLTMLRPSDLHALGICDENDVNLFINVAKLHGFDFKRV